MRLVAATEAQAEAMAQVHALAFDHPWDVPWTAEEIGDLLEGQGIFGLLVEDEPRSGSSGEPAGMLVCRVAADEAEILTVAVSPFARRRGIASALIEAAALAAQAAGATQMFLEVAEDNPGAVALYSRQGFSQAGVRQWYYSRGELGQFHALLMRRDLNVASTSA